MRSDSFTVPAGEGTVFVYRWLPDGDAKAIVVVAHGMAEHAGRYARFAHALTDAGYAVYAPDHRGHGRSVRDERELGIAGPDGWNGMVRDLERVVETARAEHSQRPSFAFGHSMGSTLVQRYIELHGELLAGAILSGTYASVAGLPLLSMIAGALARGAGARKPSPLLKKVFADFNKPFAGETDFAWLSRDADEVRKYVGDPRCGFAVSNGFVADMARFYRDVWDPANEAKIPHELPILIFSGEHDVVGKVMAEPNALAARYRANGLTDVTVKGYREARHETLNETNRDEVTQDVLAWLDARTASAPPHGERAASEP
ncbi:MAG TPA: alpha/beta hydrolase [Candidatus Baltobacteraceae bacterium]|nr:alpha/beta hydrolase [Candidatus Baltobacteraceae bacterium]